jgi:hypothetical protein
MAIEIKAPPYRVFNIAPAVKPGAMEETKTFVANDKIQENLGFPVFETTDWKEKALGKMGELLGKYRSLKVYMDACVHCGACSDKCHYFIGTGDPKNMPVARQDLMRSVYRRYFTLPGKLFPWLVGARDLTREVVVLYFALMALIQQKLQWRREKFSIQLAMDRNIPMKLLVKFMLLAITLACPGLR